MLDNPDKTVMLGKTKDFLLSGGDGLFWICDARIFAATHVLVDGPSAAHQTV